MRFFVPLHKLVDLLVHQIYCPRTYPRRILTSVLGARANFWTNWQGLLQTVQNL